MPVAGVVTLAALGGGLTVRRLLEGTRAKA